MPNHNDAAAGKDVCSARLAGFLYNPIRGWLHNPRRILGGLVMPGQTAADLGCGPGFFSLAMAQMVGNEGRVISVDLQEDMLNMVQRRAAEKGVLSRIELHQCAPDRIGIDQPVDFALAFWMVHEVPDAAAFLKEVRGFLKPDARFLLVEPKVHVSAADFQKTVDTACGMGMKASAAPAIWISRAVLLSPC